MIFFRRKPDPEVERILNVVERIMRSSLPGLGLAELKFKRGKKEVEALGRAPKDLSLDEAVAILSSLIAEGLRREGFQVEVSDEVFNLARLYREQGSISMAIIGSLMEKGYNITGMLLPVETPAGERKVSVQGFNLLGRYAFRVEVKSD